jgi:hypothetical protein
MSSTKSDMGGPASLGQKERLFLGFEPVTKSQGNNLTVVPTAKTHPLQRNMCTNKCIRSTR